MEDIYPVLKEKIFKSFNLKISKNKDIQYILNQKTKNKTMTDVSLLANTIGEYAAYSLIENLTVENLPNGILYYNIIERSVNDIMGQVHLLINKLFMIIQSKEDKKNKIGVQIITPKINSDRIQSIINKIASLESEDVIDEREE